VLEEQSRIGSEQEKAKRVFLLENVLIFLKILTSIFISSEDESSSQGDINPEFVAKRQRKAVGKNDRESSYPLLFCAIINAVKGELTNRLSEIPKLKFLSLLEFGDCKHYSEKFPADAYES
jgi:hypothetical protein